MNFDIVLVTYNSSKWVKSCFESIVQSDYDLKSLSIYVVDNQSPDHTLQVLEEVREQHGTQFKAFVIIPSPVNLGFGQGNNLGFEKGSAPYVFFLNVDTEIAPNTLNVLRHTISASEDNIAVWELRQFPYEHPKFYDPLTGATSWSSGAAFVIRREVYEHLAGFDRNFFMYVEDVDLCWRVRLLGYQLRYVPKAVVYHYSYSETYEVKPIQYFHSIINHLFLRYKFGSLQDIVTGQIMFAGLMFKRGPFEHARKQLLKRYVGHIGQLWPFLRWRFRHWKLLKQNNPAKFVGWDYEHTRIGAFHENRLPEADCPKVSVVVRTCSRPNVLREALISMRNQTYANIEIQIVEDGPNTAEKMIAKEFTDLNIVYTATGTHVGRCKVGNIGLQQATGQYINFLDDDDVFFSDHVEVLAGQLQRHPTYRVTYSLAYETPIRVLSSDPYVYEPLGHQVVYAQPFNRVMLCYHNYIPIQTIMFEKNIFLEEGGFDERLDVLEDWDLWVRYGVKNDFLYTEKITSMYRTPADESAKEGRQKQLDTALDIVRKKHRNLLVTLPVQQVADDLQAVIDSYVVKISSESLAVMRANRPLVVKILEKSMDVMQMMLKKMTAG